MAFTLKELAENPNLIDSIRNEKEPKEHTGKIECCEDCYYEEFGKFVEKNPIGPGVRRR